jgi:hypothetical protein
MKKVLIVLFCFTALSAAIFSLGCSKKNPAGPAPEATPTLTATADAAADIVAGMITNVNVIGIATVTYQVGVFTAAGVTVTTATVTVNGPNGLKNLVYNGTSGYYEFSSGSAADYQSGQKYTISVTDGLNVYSQDFYAMADGTIPADGSSASWATPATGVTIALISVIDPSFTPHLYGPGVTSPFDINGTGVYSNGTGSYFPTCTLMQTISPAFGGSNPSSMLFVNTSKSIMVLKL